MDFQILIINKNICWGNGFISKINCKLKFLLSTKIFVGNEFNNKIDAKVLGLDFDHAMKKVVDKFEGNWFFFQICW